MWKRMLLISVLLLGFALAGGGNPEVKVVNQCFQLQGEAKFLCLDKFYPGDLNITIYPNFNKNIKLAGRKSSIEKGTFKLKNQNKFVLSIDTTNIKLPILCNINTVKITSYNSNQVIDIDVKDIKDKITLKDNSGKLLLEYTIIK